SNPAGSPAVASVGPSLWMVRSARAMTSSVSVDESFEPFPSGIGVDAIDAVFDNAPVPGPKSEPKCSVRWYVTDAPGASAADVAQSNAVAVVVQSESAVEPVVSAGSASWIVTPAGSVEGPPL